MTKRVWPHCGHPRHARSTVSNGDGRVRCGFCKAIYNAAAYLRRKQEAAR